jgi:hypothetical protein
MLPHTVSFFRRNTNIEPLFVLAEQTDDLPFNKGAIINHAYAACAGMIDYVCFHDVDYMPIWAEYSEPNLPSRIVRYGLDTRPAEHGTDKTVYVQRHRLTAVAVMKKWHFETCNGYSNKYWGSSYEDSDFANRLESVGLPIKYRDSTFIALDQDSNGFNANKEIEANKKNQLLYKSMVYPNMVDGLSTLGATVVSIKQHIARGMEDEEEAPLLWCKYDLKDIYEKDQSREEN